MSELEEWRADLHLLKAWSGGARAVAQHLPVSASDVNDLLEGGAVDYTTKEKIAALREAWAYGAT